MSFELTASTPKRPADLCRAWEREYTMHGFQVEMCPNFDPTTWRGGFLPIRVSKAPVVMIGVHLREPVVSGFEVTFEDESAHFRSSSGRTTTEFALLCLGCAILANLCDGQYIDDQNGLTCNGPEAFAAAKKEIKQFLSTAGQQELVQHPFPGWENLK